MDACREKKTSVGLVMEGGAMRGLFTCGVLDVFMEEGIRPDLAAGVSAGAAFGINLKSGQKGRPLRYNMDYCGDWRYGSLWSWLRSGDFFDSRFCYEEIPFRLDPFDVKTYRKDPMRFYGVCTDLVKGKAVYRELKDGSVKDITFIRASASIPILSRPVKMGERLLLDGGIADPIPFAFVRHMGCERNIVILTREADFVMERERMLPLLRLFLHRYPNTIRMLEKRHLRYQHTLQRIREAEAEGTAFVIRPPRDLGISGVPKDPGELRRVWEIGRDTAMSRMKELKHFLNED